MKRFLTLWLLLTASLLQQANAAITVVDTLSKLKDTGSTFNFTYDIGSGSNRLLIVSVALTDSTAADMDIVTLKYNGVQMTEVTDAAATRDSGTDLRTRIYYLNESDLPSTGSYFVGLFLSGTCDTILVNVLEAQGDYLLVPHVADSTTNGITGPTSTSLTTTSSDVLLFDAIIHDGHTTLTPTGTGQTDYESKSVNSKTGSFSTRNVSSPGTYTFSWSATGSNTGNAQSMAAFAPQENDISGSVFEDTTFAGGVGRSESTSSGTGAVGARVELYDSSGDFVSATTTDASGDYTFSALSGSEYTVRTVASTVVPSVGGSGAVPVQTFRTDGTSGSVVAVTDHVGGEDPTLDEAGNGSTTLAALTSGSATPQSITTISDITSDVTGVDFGYNFNLIVNTNEDGYGSLGQFYDNAMAMPGANSSIFMISDGDAHPGMTSDYTDQLTSGVAIIDITTAFPTLTGSAANETTLDGSTQTSLVGDTNTGSLGSGDAVGTDGIVLSTFEKKEVEINIDSSVQDFFDVVADDFTFREIAIQGGQSTFRIAGDDATIEDSYIGFEASSIANPSDSNGGDTITITGFDFTLTRCLGSFSASDFVDIKEDRATITYNELIGNSKTGSASTIKISNSSDYVTVRYNKISDCLGPGIHMSHTGVTNAVIEDNTITNCGTGVGFLQRFNGVIIEGNTHTISRNIISDNHGAGIFVETDATLVTISQNSIFGNGESLTESGGAATGQIGIDLASAASTNYEGTSPFYTINDDGDADTGGNNLLNYPALEAAYISGSDLVITGWAPANATIEFFVSDTDVTGFGEGKTYIGSVVEGSVNDDDSSTSDYGSTLNCVNQGSETAANRFEYTFTKPGSVSLGTELTATATDTSGNTSEFSYVVTVGDRVPDFVVVKSGVVLSDPVNSTTNPKAIPGAVVRYSIQVSNTDDEVSDDDSVYIDCAVPDDTEMFVDDLGASGSGPVAFADGSDSSGLSYGFTSLSSGVDHLEFSNDDGVTWTYTPTPDGDGYDSNVTNIRISTSGAFNKAACGDTPSCTFTFNIRVL